MDDNMQDMSSEAQITSHERRATSNECVGSALILTVVLTSLLAIIGVLFVMVSRVDRMATSSISENKELDLAVDTVVANISQALALDVPGVTGQEYYDYPDDKNIWLANLEPYSDGTGYKWRQISDVYAKSTLYPFVQLQADIVPDYQYPIGEGDIADADGDGVSDSRWVIIPQISSGKGRPIYAAVRIIDNGAMLNANTACKFNPNDLSGTVFDIAGPDQSQINLLALAVRDPCDLTAIDPSSGQEMSYLFIEALLRERGSLDLVEYTKNVIWTYGQPNGPYTPFDISDELELRYRFLVNHPHIDTRLETLGTEQRRGWEFRTNYDFQRPAQSGDLPEWSRSAYAYHGGGLDPNYAYRHITTTYNMDRIIDPDGNKMINVNIAGVDELYDMIVGRLYDENLSSIDPVQLAAQLAVNIVDLRDADSEVTTLTVGSATYYGFEAQPYISELGFRIDETSPDISARNHFAIELYNPLDVDIPLSEFVLEIRNSADAVVGTIDLTGHVLSDQGVVIIVNELEALTTFGVGISASGSKVDPDLVLATYESVEGSEPSEYVLKEKYDVYLIRRTPAGDIYLDKQQTEDEWFDWETVKDAEQFYARQDKDWNIVYQNMEPASNTLGSSNGLDETDGTKRNYNFYNFAADEERFMSVGDIARTFIIGPSTDPDDMIGVRLDSEPDEKLVRLDLSDPNYTNLFQYLTVIDPTRDYIDNDGDGLGVDRNGNAVLEPDEIDEDELKIPGRVNVNTAPWFVIAQLPWVTDPMLPPDNPNRYNLAKAIVAYRDKLELVANVIDYSKGRGVGMVDITSSSSSLPAKVREEPGFAGISELLNVTHALAKESNPAAVVNYNYLYDIRKYGRDKELGNDKDQDTWPDMTPNDGAENDFEERDLIFSRISNLVTVRSDVYTAYILVRIGTDGPQKRVLAILDRSQVTSSGGRVRILALHSVPDPR
jgi:hypothetical protein